jgi:hypothetical protein
MDAGTGMPKAFKPYVTIAEMRKNTEGEYMTVSFFGS